MSEQEKVVVDAGAGLANAPPCANCGASLTGQWCAACGQKLLADDDRRFGHLLRQFGHALFHVDGKLPRTLGRMLLQPGRLSEAYLAGQRARYLSPIGLFLIINLVYFVAPPITDFNLSLDEQIHFQPYSPLVRSLVEGRLESRGIDLVEYGAAYDALADRLARTLIIVHLPLLALVLLGLFPRHRLYYAEHFVVACHLFAFGLALTVVSGPVVIGAVRLASRFLAADPSTVFRTLWYLLPVLILGHWMAAIRRVYRTGWPRAIASLAGWSVGLILVHMAVYRPGQFLLVFALT